MPGEFIALDWGTTSFRAYRADRAGAVLETVAAQEGILAVPAGDFEKALERRIGGWNRGLPVMAAGMITSRQGWVERPYVPCPAAASDLAAAIHAHDTATGRRIHFVTGLSCRNRAGVPEVMRSEEVQVFGSLDLGVRCFVTPGTHSKWIATDGTRILSFATYVTGEVYAALKDHTILGRLMAPGPADEKAFAQGVEAALADPGGFLNRIFSARSLALFGELAPEAVASYLSGQVIGTEVAHAVAIHGPGEAYAVLASEAIGGRYVRAMEIAGLEVRTGNAQAIVRGLAIIARSAGLLS